MHTSPIPWPPLPQASRLLALAAAAALSLASCRSHAAAGRGQRSLVTVQLRSEGQDIPFTLELACTAQQHAQGLMGRTTLTPADGMLFAFADEAPRTFWMHNTPMCLDLLFFDRKGNLTCAIDRAAPNTDTPRPCPLRSAYVVELPGGTAARQRIGPGARLLAPPQTRLCPP